MSWKTENQLLFYLVAASLTVVGASLYLPKPDITPPEGQIIVCIQPLWQFGVQIGLIAAVIFIGMIITNTKINRGKEKDA